MKIEIKIMANNFKTTIDKIILGVLLAFIVLTTHANNGDYAALENIKNDALLNAKKYEQTTKDLAKTSQITLNHVNSTIDKQWFLNKQQALLKTAYLEQDKPKDNNSKLIIFVSMSMPRQALKELLQQSRQYNAALVIQGLLDNSFPKTINTITSLVFDAGNKGGIQIEPNLFEQYKISQVPAYVINYNDDVNPDFDIVHGATGIKHALEIIKNSQTKASNTAARILQHG